MRGDCSVEETVKSIRKVTCGKYCADFTDGGRIYDCNSGMYTLTGYTKEQFENKEITFFDLIPKDDIDSYKKTVAQLQIDGGGVLEHKIVCADGKKIYVICIGEDFKDSNGHDCVSITISNTTDKVDLQKKYVHSKREIDALIDNFSGGIFVGKLKNGTPELVKASGEMYRILGFDADSITNFQSCMSKEDVEKLESAMLECIQNQLSFQQDFRVNRPDGSRIWIRINGRYFDCDSDGFPMVYCALTNITELKENEYISKKQSICFKMVSENTEGVFFEYDVDTDCCIVTSRTEKYDEKIGKNAVIRNYIKKNHCGETVYPEDKSLYQNMWKNALSVPTKGSAEFRTNIVDKEYRWYRAPYVSVANDDGEITNVYGMLYSIEHVKNMKSKIARDRKEIERLSSTDPVTELYNRSAFTKFAEKYLEDNYNDDECFAIVYSDINDFSYVNENFGYEAGNRMLYDFADILRGVGISVNGSRIYSDYFVSLNRASDRETLIKEVGTRNSAFTSMQKNKYPMSDIQVSSGVYFLHSDYEDINIAIDNANLARRSIKGSQEIPCGVYSERMRQKRRREQSIASEIWNAIKSGKIELFLQPKFDLVTRDIIGAEALTRWRNNDGTYKMPYEFIDVLENVGSIIQLDIYIYEQVLKCLSKWKKENRKLIPISINFSRKHNNYPDFVERVNGLANFYDVDKSLIEIEITESCFTQDVKNLFSNMRRLRDQGFKVDIDDFGMGYSSLSVLMDAPVDIVKVDKVFIDNIGFDEKSRDYINKMCSLIQTTDKEIIFEGVETEDQAKILSESGHRMAQGWLFDKAIPVEEFERKYL
jgi:diguanylate cyclase (GGDEF)-like protein/PAS domain S-box-containing protein